MKNITNEQVEQIVNTLAQLNVPVVVASQTILPIIKILQTLPAVEKNKKENGASGVAK